MMTMVIPDMEMSAVRLFANRNRPMVRNLLFTVAPTSMASD